MTTGIKVCEGQAGRLIPAQHKVAGPIIPLRNLDCQDTKQAGKERGNGMFPQTNYAATSLVHVSKTHYITGDT